MCIQLHIGVGFGVACLDDLSNARAIECETGNKSDSHAFCIYAVDERNRSVWRVAGHLLT